MSLEYVILTFLIGLSEDGRIMRSKNKCQLGWSNFLLFNLEENFTLETQPMSFHSWGFLYVINGM